MTNEPNNLMTDTPKPRVSITSLQFSDSTELPISTNDVILIVGPNNAGKSATLRAIRDKLRNSAHVSPVLRTLHISRFGSIDDFETWMLEWAVCQKESSPNDPVFQALGQAVQRSRLRSVWPQNNHELGELTRWFCHLLSADERLQICNPPGNIALTRDNPSHPIHFLLRDDKLEARLSNKFRKAFGVDLVVHRNAGGQVPVHVGDRPTPGAGEDRVSLSYIERIEKLDMLHTQGDGMRSFAGVLLATSVGGESIVLIDEPEAFLHPPQARLLGTTLIQDRSKERQLFIATHSTDILRGVLDADSPDVKVIRISRSGNLNNVRHLSNERIKELWGDPLLRYSNILDGLFHEGVIVCEADADCRFYSAILDAITSGDTQESRRPDLMFTHCGGKARLPVVVRSLREVDVPVRVVADFDVLSEEQPLRSIVETLGMAWSSIEPDWKLVKAAVDSKKPDLKTDDLKREISNILGEVDLPIFPKIAKSKIQAVLKKTSAWAHAKSVGKAFVPSGDPSAACERLFASLRAGGLFVVDVGELEGFAKTISGHGPKWVNSVLEKEIATDPELLPAREFVKALARV